MSAPAYTYDKKPTYYPSDTPNDYNSVGVLAFRANLVREHSAIPKVDELGSHVQEMELYLAKPESGNWRWGDCSGNIEWRYGRKEAGDDVTTIGVSFENGRLVDYDGVFSLPWQAVTLLRAAGLIVPRDFVE